MTGRARRSILAGRGTVLAALAGRVVDEERAGVETSIRIGEAGTTDAPGTGTERPVE